jgi:hypothetical protein
MKKIKIDTWISEIGDYFVSIDPGTGLDSTYAKLWKAYGYPEYSTLMTEEETPEKEKIKTLNESRLKEIKP